MSHTFGEKPVWLAMPKAYILRSTSLCIATENFDGRRPIMQMAGKDTAQSNKMQ